MSILDYVAHTRRIDLEIFGRQVGVNLLSPYEPVKTAQAVIQRSEGANPILNAPNPAAGLVVKRIATAMGRKTFIINDFSQRAPDEARQRAADGFRGAEPGSAVLIYVQPLSSFYKRIADVDSGVRKALEESMPDPAWETD